MARDIEIKSFATKRFLREKKQKKEEKEEKTRAGNLKKKKNIYLKKIKVKADSKQQKLFHRKKKF